MFCGNCGQENDDRAVYCRMCGQALQQPGAGAGASAQAGRQKTQGITDRFSYEKSGGKTRSARVYIASLAGSYLFLAAAICSSLVILVSLFQLRNGNGLIQRIMNMIMEYGGMGGYAFDSDLSTYYEIMNYFAGGANVAAAIVKLLPLIVVCIGLWLIFAQGRNQFAGGSVGFTVLKVVEWITLVMNGLTLVVVTILLFILAVKTTPLFLLFAVIYIGFSAISLGYHWLVIKSLGNAQNAVSSDRPSVPVSMYVLVMTFVMAFTGFVGGIVSGSLLTSLSEAAATVIFGILIIQFNGGMQTLIQGGEVDYDDSRISFQPASPPDAGSYTPAEDVEKTRPIPDPPFEYHPAGPGVYQDKPRAAAMIVNMERGEEIPINRSPFVIGKDPSRVDYALSDQPTVSRVHAQIIERSGAFYLMDLGSTNHTFLNQRQIPDRQEVPLHDGEAFTCARVRFEFRLYR